MQPLEGAVAGMLIAGSDRVFYPAEVHMRGGYLLASSPKVPSPVAVRYGWADNPGPLHLYNQQGLPLLPFRTDSWPLSTEGEVFQWDPWGF